ncbi:DNA translocase FtsK [Sporolactobacillus sp. CPB3-1]|uniref:DNA translocase FtsK n=1 Tax=Sporolactobacillus mangiferae TaxID=2940498 RepID=A0ABT0M709_9BACL|nr:DNA translocase FtsK [Sporolactobacillus mangiferae]MCL1630645.1 DNA translocase FtsK [Sporolactobacillus mangiferae]
MSDSWWRRLFNLDEQEETSQERDRNEPPAPVGRFKDANRHVEVKMCARYPERQGHQNVHSDKGKKIERSAPSHQSSEYYDKKPKQPFRLTKIPSPVFGFHEPPKQMRPKQQERSFYLEHEKEEQERKQIQERKQELIQHPDEFGSDRPALERKKVEQPVVQKSPIRFHEGEAGRISKTEQQKSQASTPSTTDDRSTQGSGRPQPKPTGEPGQPDTVSEPELHDRHYSHQQEVLRVSSSLPRSPHRHESQSKVPFNVLMFHSDRAVREKQAEPAVQSNKAEVAQFPLDLLHDAEPSETDRKAWIDEKQAILIETLENFHVDADVTGYVQGPSVTRYDLRLHPGVKINKVLSLTEDIKLSLAARQIRIAPVPGTSAVGIEIPNKVRKPVLLKDLLKSDTFTKSTAPLTAALGQDVSGNQVVTDLAKMPHGLIAGATGSGKSVCIHSLILSLIYRTSPEQLRFLLIDPKVVELAPYQEIPHLAAPVITEPKEAAAALKWAVEEMEQRYRLFARNAVRDMEGYNRKLHSMNADALPYIVIIIDELADLMMVAPQDVEESVCRIAQKARAAGIHLLVATQRPSVDVITGLIKSNIPTRIAFSVSSQTDSRTILDCGGAERLLGRGDLLFSENGSRSLRRLQACYVSDEEINQVTHAFHNHPKTDYLFSPETARIDYERSEQEDELLSQAAEFVVDQGQASVSSIQRHFRIGYNRAARLVDELELRNIISSNNGSKPRQVLVSKDKLNEQLSERDLEQM